MSARLLGRSQETETASLFLESARGETAALVIQGPPGIGKTALVDHVRAEAEERARRVLSCRPSEAESKLPFAGLADLLEPVVDEVLPQLPAPQASGLAVALLREEAQAAPSGRAISMGAVSALSVLARSSPVLMSIDDVQWMDQETLGVLEFAVRRLSGPIGVLVAERTDGQKGLPLDLDRAMPRERLFPLFLGPVTVAVLHQLIKDRLGVSFPRPTLLKVYEVSGGNPLFGLEIARALEAREAPLSPADPLPVPGTLTELVQTRTATLSERTREALLIAAAAPDPRLQLVEAALGSSDTGWRLEAEEAGIVEIHAELVRFTHPLLSSSLYTYASGERRRRIHQKLADLVREPEERALHLALSVTGPDETVAAALEEAGWRARRRGAQRAATELFERSRALTPQEHAEKLPPRTLAEASSLLAAGDVPRARALAETALESALDGPLRAEVLLLLAEIHYVENESELATARLEGALEDAAGDPSLLGRIHARLASRYELDQARAVEHAYSALELLDPGEEPRLTALVLMTKFFFEAQLGRGARRELLRTALELEDATTGFEEERSGLPLIWFKCMDEFESARSRYEIEAESARRRGEEGWAAERLAQLAEVELRSGNWELAERYIETSCSGVEQVGPKGPWAMPFRLRAMIDAHMGRIDRSRATLVDLVEETEHAGNLWWAALSLSTLGFLELTLGDPSGTDRALTRMERHLAAIGVKDALGIRSEPDHIEALTSLGELNGAESRLARLEERGRVLPRRWITATLPRSRALVLAAQGELDTATEVLRRGLDEPDAVALPFDLARNLLVLGQIERRAGRRRAAAEALRRSLETFERLGSPQWSERARTETARLGLRRSATDELTETEKRVAEMAAAGMTNKQVADALFVSPKTVEANLARIYRKLGIRSRAELGARVSGSASR